MGWTTVTCVVLFFWDEMINMHVQCSIWHFNNVACQPKTLNNNASLPLVWALKLSHTNSLPGHEGTQDLCAMVMLLLLLRLLVKDCSLLVWFHH